MRRGTLKSKLIKSIGYDEKTIKMEIEYKADGEVITYSGVPFSVFKAVVRAKSPGEYWMKVRDKYDWSKK